MIGALEILRRERDEAAEQIRVLRARIKDLESAIAVLEGQPLAARPGRSGGDLKATVLENLRSFGSSGATPKEIADALTRGGRQTSDASVSSTLSRLKAESKVINRSGRWFAANPGFDSQASTPSEWADGDQKTTDWEFDDESAL